MPVYRAAWQSGNRRRNRDCGEPRLTFEPWTSSLGPGKPGNRSIAEGDEIRGPDIIQLNEGVGEHVRTKISPRLKQRG